MKWHGFAHIGVSGRMVFLACMAGLDIPCASAEAQGLPEPVFVTHAISAIAPDPSLRAASEEKKRVPKPPPEPPRYKPDTTSTSSYSSDEDESWTAQCIGECLGNVFTSICSGLAESITSSRRSGRAWAVGDRAELSAGTESDSVALRESLDAERPEAELSKLAAGDRVEIVETFTTADGVWLRVRPVDRVAPVGWVRQSSAWRIAAGAVKPQRLPGPSAGIVRVAAGGGGFGPSELNVEYRNGGYRLDVQYLRTPTRHWLWGGGAGFRYATGHPAVLYVTPSRVEDPQRSRLWMLDVGLRGGYRVPLGSTGLGMDWLLGPTVAYVHEWSDLQVYDATMQTFIERREDSLGRWAAGGDLRMVLGTARGSRPGVALVVDGYALAWRGQRTRSLTSDFVRNAIHGFDVALAFTFGSR